MHLELVVLDMAGTTVFDGDAVHHSLQAALEHKTGIRVARDEVNDVMGIPKPIAIRQLLEQKSSHQPAGDLVELVLLDFERRMLEYYDTNPAVRPIPGAIESFAWMRSTGLRIALDTGFSRAIAQAILDRLDWQEGQIIDACVTADDVAAGRPAPDMIFRAMELTGITDVKKVAKVGDTPSDLLEGHNAGCGVVIGVTEGSHTAEQLRPFPHTHLIGSVRELPDVLTRYQSALSEAR